MWYPRHTALGLVFSNYTTFRQLSANKRFVSTEWRKLLLNNGFFVQEIVLILDCIWFVTANSEDLSAQSFTSYETLGF
jgi:hypothetical protein